MQLTQHGIVTNTLAIPDPVVTKEPSCNVCRDLDEELMVAGRDTQKHPKKKLIESASQGCKYCFVILEGIVKFFPGWRGIDHVEAEPDCFTISSGFNFPLTLTLCPEGESPSSVAEGTTTFLQFYTLPGEQHANPVFGKAQDVPQSRPDCLEMIPKWLERCFANHPNCRKLSDPTLPARVIDLHAGGLESDDWTYYRLHEAKDHKAPYVCLSYCWGGPQAFKTTKDSLAAMRRRINCSDLPKLFQSAVSVTRGLGFRYLWIDCLCIIQDDLEDWERESGNMRKIYGDANLVLAASTSESPASGFFRGSSPADGHFEIPYHWEGVVTETVHVRRAFDHGRQWKLPLSNRAWTFQETWLPCRVVHFLYDEIVFECDSASWCCCSDPGDTTSVTSQNSVTYHNAASEFSVRRGAKSLDKFQAWNMIVEQYTSRSLTNDSDKLPALSGVASTFREGSNSIYLAGLWSESLITGLCWYSPRLARRRPSQNRGPSWSWVSIEGAVKFPGAVSIMSIYETGDFSESLVMGNLETIEVRELYTECGLGSSDPTGSVTYGKVTLVGRVATATYKYLQKPEKFAPYLCCKGEVEEAFYADFSGTEELETGNSPKEGDQIYILKIGLVGWPPEPPVKFRALVLRAAKGEYGYQQGCLERIGFIDSSDHDSDDWFKDMNVVVLAIV